jgi:hypothetical protein
MVEEKYIFFRRTEYEIATILRNHAINEVGEYNFENTETYFISTILVTV